MYRVYYSHMKTLTRGQLAEASEVGTETIRFYEQKGLLLPGERSSNGYRRYSADAVNRLRFIRRAKNLGFDLKQIERRIRDLQRMRDVLSQLATECSGRGRITGCPIIQALDGDEAASTVHGGAR